MLRTLTEFIQILLLIRIILFLSESIRARRPLDIISKSFRKDKINSE